MPRKKTTKRQAKTDKPAEPVAAAPPDAVDADAGDDQDEDGHPDNLPTLYMHVPFALAGVDAPAEDGEARNAQFLEENPESGVPGTFASVLCSCGQPFKFNLLTADVKECPGCAARYTHMLVVGAEDDPSIVGHTWFHLLTENNLMPEGLGDEDEDEDEDEDAAAEIPDAK